MLGEIFCTIFLLSERSIGWKRGQDEIKDHTQYMVLPIQLSNSKEMVFPISDSSYESEKIFELDVTFMYCWHNRNRTSLD